MSEVGFHLVVVGTIFQTPTADRLEVLNDVVVSVDRDGVISCLLAHGTTTAVYYSSIHEEATLRLAKTCAEIGQRAFVGRVAMDHPEGTPPWYRDTSAASAVSASVRSVEAIRTLSSWHASCSGV